MQASLPLLGMVAALAASWLRRDGWLALGALLLVSVVPFTLLVILPTNRRLLDPALDRTGGEAAALLVRWGRLHAVRSVLSAAAFLIFLVRLSTP